MIFFFFLDIGDPVSTLQSYVCLKKKQKKQQQKNSNVQGEMLLDKHKPIFWRFLMRTLCLKW